MNDDELREALKAEADASQPISRGWERLEERLGEGKGRRGRWLLPVVAAAVVLLAAVGAWQLSRDDGVKVDVGSETSSTIAATVVPATTAPAPASTISSTTAPSTTPTTLAPTGPPTQVVAVTIDGRLVVLDATTGAELRELADLGDPRGGAAEGPGPNAVTQVSVTPDGSTAYYDSCCEPAAGLIFAVATDGRRPPEPVTNGLGPAVSPDGRFLAYTAINAVVVRDLTTGEEQAFTDPAYDTEPVFGGVAWSRDGARVYYPWERRRPDGTAAGSAFVELTVAAGEEPRVLAEVPDAAMADLLPRDDRRTVSVLLRPLQLDGSAGPQDGELIVDTATGSVQQTTAGGFADRSLDRETGMLVLVREDGTLVLDGAEAGTGYALADW